MGNVIVGILGSRLDHGGLGKRRWERWRPSVALLMHSEFPVDEFLLMYLPEDQVLLDLTIHDMAQVSPQTKVTAVPIHCDDPWDFEQVYSQIHDVAINQSFDVEQNNYFINITTGTHVAQICLYLLTEAHYLPGKLLQSSPSKEGAPGVYHVIDLDLSRYDQIASRFAKESSDAVIHLKSGIHTRNKAFNSLIEQLEQVSIKSTAPILLNGPTGAGKSQLAKRIYELKKLRGQLTGELVEVNCATLRGDNAMSALFGHVKGAFTGALNARMGLLREADKGLLFLDEIGELGLDEQAMLLRAIEEKIFMPFGGDQPVSSNFQLIAGTHRNLFDQVRQGLFREDLLARINLWTYELPSLKERIEDLEPNIEHELQKFTRNAGYKVNFNKGARDQYLQFANSSQALWRANFRDLNSSITRMATLAVGGRITEALVDGEIVRLQQAWSGFQASLQLHADLVADVLSPEQLSELDLFDRLQLNEVIKVCRNSRSLAEAGRVLFNASREKKSSANDSHRVKQYLQKFGLTFQMLNY
ncbi:MAG: RNA repair transcriptional activator RtcR [Cellvibrio sp.]|uniref:RNA repair transcriptional activator RtcR n=1 Tax=Cellvibrio sp. TaxID=1965322 RepID=UPI0031A9D08E